MSANQADQKQALASTAYRLPLEKLDNWQALVQQACELCAPQIESFALRLSHSLYTQSESANDSKLANLCFHGAQLLKNNVNNFYLLSSAALEAGLSKELVLLRAVDKAVTTHITQDISMSLVSYEEMELKLSFSRASRSLELAYAEPLAALNMRLASLLDQESINGAQNPFRPEVLLRAFNTAWRDFNPETAAHALILPILSELIFDLAPVYHALNALLIKRGVLPDLQETYRLKRKQASMKAARVGEAVKNEVTKKLEQYFSEQESDSDGQGGSYADAGGANFGHAGEQADEGQFLGAGHRRLPHEGANYHPPFNPATSELFQYLADVQKSMALQQLVAGAQNTRRASHTTQMPPAGQMRQFRQDMPAMPNLRQNSVEKNTYDLLSQVFEGVFGNRDIPEPIKDLIGTLQVPVLKAALIDKDFFFQEAHPARRLIELLSKYSVSFDPEKGEDDPLFQNMQRNVQRVQKEFDQQLGLFDEVVSDLENFIRQEEVATIEALQAPINRALQKEKFKQASIAASNEISLRIGSGEVLGFVETFLENRWTKVLTLAYSVKEEKPHAIADAIKTMDDLIWSIKPKITLAQRQEMINRLPAILARLNKWLSLIKWEDADRMQFFADLAECHASIVRAPLELSPERQVEIAVEAAKIATERRLEKRAKEEAEAKEKAAEELRQQGIEKNRLVAQAIAKAKKEILKSQQAKLKRTAANAKLADAASETKTRELAQHTVALEKQEPTLEENSEIGAKVAEEVAPIEINEASIAADVEQQIEDAATTVANLERGVWVSFLKNDGEQQKVRLAWISPMRSLFIFTSSQKEQSFSVPIDELEKNFREKRAITISVDKVVDKALQEALKKKVSKDIKNKEVV